MSFGQNLTAVHTAVDKAPAGSINLMNFMNLTNFIPPLFHLYIVNRFSFSIVLRKFAP